MNPKHILITSFYLVLNLGGTAITSLLPSPALAAESTKNEKIVICTGESARQNIFRHVEAEFTKAHQIDFVYPLDPKKGGVVESLKELIAGTCEALASSGGFDDLMKIFDENKIDFDKKKFTHRVIGRDLIKFVINKKNNVNQITMKQLANILSGKSENWKEVGGADQPIKFYIANKKPSTNTSLKNIILKTETFSAKAVYLDTWEEIIANIGKETNGLGFMSSNVDTSSLKLLKTEEDVGRPTVIITIGKPSDRVQKLVSFIKDNEKRLLPK